MCVYLLHPGLGAAPFYLCLKRVTSMSRKIRYPDHVLLSHTRLCGRGLKATLRSKTFFLPAGPVEVPSLSCYTCSYQAEHTSQRSLDSKLKQGHRAAGRLVGFSTKTLPGTRSGHWQPRIHTGPRTIYISTLSSVQRQQDKPNMANIDYSNDILYVCLPTAHKSPMFYWRLSHPVNSWTSIQQDVCFCYPYFYLHKRDLASLTIRADHPNSLLLT